METYQSQTCLSRNALDPREKAFRMHEGMPEVPHLPGKRLPHLKPHRLSVELHLPGSSRGSKQRKSPWADLETGVYKPICLEPSLESTYKAIYLSRVLVSLLLLQF